MVTARRLHGADGGAVLAPATSRDDCLSPWWEHRTPGTAGERGTGGRAVPVTIQGALAVVVQPGYRPQQVKTIDSTDEPSRLIHHREDLVPLGQHVTYRHLQGHVRPGGDHVCDHQLRHC